MNYDIKFLSNTRADKSTCFSLWEVYNRVFIQHKAKRDRTVVILATGNLKLAVASVRKLQFTQVPRVER